MRQLAYMLTLICTTSLSYAAHARTFEAEGSDLFVGVGAKQIAMGGAAAASADDIYAIYWNPAGLAEMNSTQISLSRQLNATLSPINFFGIGIVSEKLNFSGLKSTLSFGLLPRLHAASTGAYQEDELQSMFLRFALPDLPGNFDGKLETKTRDYRLSWAITPQNQPSWSIGVSLSRIECRTNFCGVSANDPGNYIVESTTATAYGFHFGGKYYYSDNLTFGLNVEDVLTELDVQITTIDNNGTTNKTFQVPLPRDIAVGLLWRKTPALDLTLDYQYLSGDYGVYNLDIQALRGGVSYKSGAFDYRGGFIIPAVIESAKTGSVMGELPAPVLPSIGLGWNNKKWKMDFSLYPHPLMSYHHKAIYPAADLSLSYTF